MPVNSRKSKDRANAKIGAPTSRLIPTPKCGVDTHWPKVVKKSRRRTAYRNTTGTLVIRWNPAITQSGARNRCATGSASYPQEMNMGRHLVRGILAGVAGGLAAAWVMNEFNQTLGQKLSKAV